MKLPEKRSAPAAERNREPIARVLADELPKTGLVLEVASGTGEHAIHFATAFPGLTWQPTDHDANALASIEGWRQECGGGNILPPIQLDASAFEWPVEQADAIYCSNMVHISPIAATKGLIVAAANLLAEGAPLILYGPYIESSVVTAGSNLAFDASLKSRNPDWGLRDIAWLDGLAQKSGLSRTARYAMPANNLTLVYRKL